MGQQQSKDELLYQQVNYGNVEGIKALCREGAGLEWIDKEGKTPLIVACMNPELISVATTLIELGANVNAFRPGCHAGTPLHHAAKRGLEQTVNLLLSHGANAFLVNDDCQTPLEVARMKGYSNVVRTIENRISFFSGWLREIHGPGFLEALASQWLSKKVWVVVAPCGSRNPSKPLKLELAVYPSAMDAMPRTVIALWKTKTEEPKFHQSDPVVIIFDNGTKTRYKFASANEGDKQQLQCFYGACRGQPQVMHPPVVLAPLIPASAPPIDAEDTGFGISSDASIQSAMEERPPSTPNTYQSPGVSNSNKSGNSTDNSDYSGWGKGGRPAPPSSGSCSGGSDKPAKEVHQGWGDSEAGPSSSATQLMTQENAETSSIPSAPPLPGGADVDDSIHYPLIDCSPVDLLIPTGDSGQGSGTSEAKDGNSASSCVICLDAPIEGACIPCGHMAGCMSCLNGIKAKKWGCPVCRAKINQVMKLYAV